MFQTKVHQNDKGEAKQTWIKERSAQTPIVEWEVWIGAKGEEYKT